MVRLELPRVHLHPGLYFDPFQSGLAEKLRYPAADPRIGAVAAKCDREDVPEPVEGRVRRVAQRMLSVWFHGRDPAARAGQPGHLGGCSAGLGRLTSRARTCTRSKQGDGSPVFLASAVMISTPLSPRAAANSAAMAVCAGSESRPTTQPAGATRTASRSRIPRGPQPRSIALCPDRRPTGSSSAALSPASSSACRCSRALSPWLLPSGYRYPGTSGRHDRQVPHRSERSRFWAGLGATSGESCRVASGATEPSFSERVAALPVAAQPGLVLASPAQ
jgi:hypothetical protein